MWYGRGMGEGCAALGYYLLIKWVIVTWIIAFTIIVVAQLNKIVRLLEKK